MIKVSDIQKDVRVILDSNDSDGKLEGLSDPDTLRLNELIHSKVCDAVRYCIEHAELYLLGSGKNLLAVTPSTEEGQAAAAETTTTTVPEIHWNNRKGYGSGWLKLPDDFLRLVAFQMSDWSYPVSEPITSSDPAYAKQYSRYAGIRGNAMRPVVAIVNHADGLMLEFFSCMEGSTVSIRQLSYIPMPEITTADEVDIPVKLYDAVKYYLAYLVAATLEMGTAQHYLETAKTYLE